MEIAEHAPPLTIEEEIVLGEQIIKSIEAEKLLDEQKISLEEYEAIDIQGRQAREKIVLHNIRFVIRTVRSFRPRSSAGMRCTTEDLVGEGVIGLVNAVEKFDPREGRFLSFASYFVEAAIKDHATHAAHLISLTEAYYQEFKIITQAIKKIEQENAGKATEEMLQEKLGISGKQLRSMMQNVLAMNSISLDVLKPKTAEKDRKTNGGMGFEPFAKTSDSESQLQQKLRREHIETLMADALDEREEKVITGYYGFYGERKTLREIAKEEDLTRERVRQIKREAEQKLVEKFPDHILLELV